MLNMICRKNNLHFLNSNNVYMHTLDINGQEINEHVK
jgi:hypothetical protein